MLDKSLNNIFIPKNIILFFHDHLLIPEIYHHALNITKKANKFCKFIHADDAYVEGFIKDRYSENILKLYRLNRVPASRSDLARLFLLFEYGGFYIDSSMEIRKPLKDILEVDTEVLLVRRDDAKRYQDNPEGAHVINGIIAAKPKSKYVERCLELALMHVSSGMYNTNVWKATGPFVLNQILKKDYGDEKVKIVNFTDLLSTTVSYKRPSEQANLWLKQQELGIIDSCFYKDKNNKFFL